MQRDRIRSAADRALVPLKAASRPKGRPQRRREGKRQEVHIADVAVLSASRGIHLLTCPKTREQYVGSGAGGGGFYGRWLSYAQDGHGGNVALKSRDPSDYQVSILEVAGSSATLHEIMALEILWKRKLQSRDTGLNKN